MFEQLRFYIQHSLNDLRVNRQRTLFALLCIAAGVAAIVSLQTVAVMMTDSLSTNLQASNRGDIRIELMGTSGNEERSQQGVDDGVLVKDEIGLFGQGADVYYIGESGFARLQEWIDENYPGQIEITYPYIVTDFIGIFFGGGTGTSATIAETGASANQLTPVLIDPAVYPFYNEVRSKQGEPLSALLTSPTDIVLDERSAQTLGANIGDLVRVNGANTDFTVRGIVPTAAEISDPFSGFLAGQFGFYYLNRDAVQFFEEVSPRTDRLYFRLSNPEAVDAIEGAFQNRFPYLTTTTTSDLREQNQQIADTISDLVTVMGLVSLLVGSIGIINTMQVIVQRRTIEVAVLKTLGLQANQVTVLFLVEALIMGIVGSLIGIVLGWASTFLIKSVAETFIGQPLAFRIAVAPAFNGFLVGVLVTAIFGFLPTLSAGQVRPGIVLRPSENVIPRAGRGRIFLALIVIIFALSLVAQTILGSFTTAFTVVFGAFIAAGVLYLMLMTLIWLFGRLFPSFGVVDLKVSLRQMLVSRRRNAITLLALVVGVFSLSLITLFSETITQALDQVLTGSGDVLIVAQNERTIEQVRGVLDSVESVEGYRINRNYTGTFVRLERANGETVNEEQLRAIYEESTREERELAAQFGGEQAANVDFAGEFIEDLGVIGGVEAARIPTNEVIGAGRQLTPDDAGTLYVVMRETDAITDAAITVGDKLTYTFEENGDEVTFEVIGIARATTTSISLGSSDNYTLYESVADLLPTSGANILVDIPKEEIPALRRELARIPNVFALEMDVLNQLISGLLGTFQAFPTLVAALGLIVGGVVIANSVALSSMERRREIAVMKSVGLQRERVLGMLLVENAILGLIGGLIGVGIGFVALALLLAASGGASSIPYGTAFVLMLLCVAVAIVAALTTAWGASGEKPLNVLRYE
jgi:ABC-type antimicrobial peptide transport system permease subunit